MTVTRWLPCLTNVPNVLYCRIVYVWLLATWGNVLWSWTGNTRAYDLRVSLLRPKQSDNRTYTRETHEKKKKKKNLPETRDRDRAPTGEFFTLQTYRPHSLHSSVFDILTFPLLKYLLNVVVCCGLLLLFTDVYANEEVPYVNRRKTGKCRLCLWNVCFFPFCQSFH